MAKSSIVTSDVYTKTVKVTSISPVSSTLNQISESLMPVPLSSFKTTRLHDDESFKSKISNGVTVVPTYAKTDGVKITTGGGGGTYWITG